MFIDVQYVNGTVIVSKGVKRSNFVDVIINPLISWKNFIRQSIIIIRHIRL